MSLVRTLRLKTCCDFDNWLSRAQWARLAGKISTVSARGRILYQIEGFADTPVDEIRDNDAFTEIGLNSLDLVEINMELENEFALGSDFEEILGHYANSISDVIYALRKQDKIDD